jgi:hypothetical protein
MKRDGSLPRSQDFVTLHISNINVNILLLPWVKTKQRADIPKTAQTPGEMFIVQA